MAAETSWVLSLLLVTVMMGSSYAYDFYVGGRQGWVQKPSESYDAWAGRNRFQVNDRLVFKYKKGEDSVLVVTEAAYRACLLSNPIKRLDDGDSVFRLDRPGTFYFLSGAPGRCQAGQKLVVVVLSPRGGRQTSRPAASPLPSAAPSPLPPPAGLPPSPLGAPSPALPLPPTAGPGTPAERGAAASATLSTIVGALALAGATIFFYV